MMWKVGTVVVTVQKGLDDALGKAMDEGKEEEKVMVT
jgi:hypothetical protein